MPIETRFQPDVPYDTQIIRGHLVPEEVVSAMKRLYQDPAHDASRPVLWDARRMRGDSSYSDIFSMVERSTSIWELMRGGRSAILVSDRNHLGPARLYAKLAEAMPRDLGVFTRIEDAEAWLTETYSLSAKAS